MNWLERCWYHSHPGYLMLLPLSWLYGVLSALRRLLFRIGILKRYKLAVPVIVVGNISVGGTGKTPFCLMLCNLLQQQGWRPGIVSRGYGVKLTEPVLITSEHTAAQVGDEPLLLARSSHCPVVVYPDRVAAARHLLNQTDANIIISDDGLQHYSLVRDLEVVLVDGLRQFGNGQLLPAGPLREKPWRLAKANLVIANTAPVPCCDGVMTLKPAAARSLINDSELAPTKINLVAAIGNPQRFYRTVTQAGFDVQQCHFFPDHYAFNASDLTAIDTPLLMTEKDAVKCQPFAKTQWYFLPITAQLDQPADAKLLSLLTQLRRQYAT